MKTYWFLFSLILPIIGLKAAVVAPAAAISANSSITAVTVYPDRALVTRSAQITLEAGTSEVLVSGLPASLLDESVQVSAQGIPVTLLDVSNRVVHQSGVANPLLAELENRLEVLSGQQTRLLQQEKLISRQLEIISNIENTVSGATVSVSNNASLLPAEFAWRERKNILDFSMEQRGAILEKQLANADRIKELSGEIEALRAQIRELQQAALKNTRSTKTLTMRFECAVRGDLNIAFSYVLPGARWTPLYDTRLLPDSGDISLTYFGMVYNNTGENWKNIALTLSTARPGLGGAAPKPMPRTLDIAKPQPPKVLPLLTKSGSPYNEALPAARGALAENADSSMALSGARVTSSTTSASFQIPYPATVPADNSPQKLSITTATLPADLSYQTTPGLSETAFLSASLSNTTEYPLLAGRSNIFIGPSFIASADLETIMPGEKFSIPLGADEGISVKRRLINRHTAENGVLNKTVLISYDMVFEIANNKREPAEIVLREPLPLSGNEKIVVKLQTPAEKDIGQGREVSREDGNILAWKIVLKPGEERKIPFKYTVEYPAEAHIIGLD